MKARGDASELSAGQKLRVDKRPTDTGVSGQLRENNQSRLPEKQVTCSSPGTVDRSPAHNQFPRLAFLNYSGTLLQSGEEERPGRSGGENAKSHMPPALVVLH